MIVRPNHQASRVQQLPLQPGMIGWGEGANVTSNMATHFQHAMTSHQHGFSNMAAQAGMVAVSYNQPSHPAQQFQYRPGIMGWGRENIPGHYMAAHQPRININSRQHINETVQNGPLVNNHQHRFFSPANLVLQQPYQQQLLPNMTLYPQGIEYHHRLPATAFIFNLTQTSNQGQQNFTNPHIQPNGLSYPQIDLQSPIPNQNS